MGSSVDLHSRHVKERCLGTHLVLEDSSDDFSSVFFILPTTRLVLEIKIHTRWFLKTHDRSMVLLYIWCAMDPINIPPFC